VHWSVLIMQLKLALPVIVSCTLCSAAAIAQTSPSNKAAADTLYEEGIKSAIAGDYPSAVIHFQNGYKLDPDPRFLYNIAACYYRLDNFERASDYYQRVLKSPNVSSEIYTKAASKLRALELQLSATTVSDQIKDGAGQANKGDGAQTPDPSKKPEDEGFGGLGWAGVAVTAVGVGLMGASLIPNAGLSDQIAEYEDGVRLDPSPSRDQSRYDAIQSKQSTGKLLLFSGAGLTVVGASLVLYELASSSSQEAAAQETQGALTPLFNISPDGAAVGIRLSF